MPEISTVGFVCDRNAGRSRMASAFAERERAARDLGIEIVTGGTRPAEIRDEIERRISTLFDELERDRR